MVKLLCLPVLALALLLPVDQTFAQDDKALQKERQDAQKVRQQAKSARAEKFLEATKSFRSFLQDLDAGYKEQIRDMESDFQVKLVDLRADRDTRVAEAEADYQKRMMDLFTDPGLEYDAGVVKQLEGQWKQYSDQLFEVKKDFGAAEHAEIMSKERLENQLLADRDRKALQEAGNLGLTADIPPILAQPMGDGLTKKEQQWNDKELKEVERLKERNLKLIRDFKVGNELRQWEMANMKEDFQLEWQEKTEAHELESEQLFFNAVMMQAAQGKQIDQQDISAKIAELNKQSKLIKIKYDSMRKKNEIKRKDEKRKIQGL